MATAEVIKRLSTRATAAEKMIQLLKTQINEIKASQGMACGVDEELKKLRIENSQLKVKNEYVAFPPCLNFLSLVSWTFLTLLFRVLRRIQSPYLIKKKGNCIDRESNPGLLGER